MIYEHEVREKIASLLSNEMCADDFARWIMANSWNMHQDSSHEAVDLVSSVHLLMAERDDETYAEQEFRKDLQALLDKIVVSDPVDLIANPQAPTRHFTTNSARPLSIAPALVA